MTLIKSVICILVILMGPVCQASGDIFGDLAGTWHGSGEVRGMSSEQTMVWVPALGGQFTRLEFDNRMHQAGGPEFHFQAHAYYQVAAGGDVSGHWFDSRGVKFPLQGTQGGLQLNIKWGTPETELGRTVYRIVAEQLQVTDEVLGADGQWRVFGRSTLQRAIPPAE